MPPRRPLSRLTLDASPRRTDPWAFVLAALLGASCGGVDSPPAASSPPAQDVAQLRASAQAHFEQGRSIIEQHMSSPSHTALRQAVEHLQRAVKVAPEEVEYRLWAARAYELLLNNEAALEHYREAVAGGHDQARTWRRLGTLALNLGELGEARTAFERALSRGSEEPELFFGYGCLLDLEDQLEEAATAFARAVELRPSFDDAHYRRAQVLRALGDEVGAARAEAQFQHWNKLDKQLLNARKAARLQPTDLPRVRALALLYFEMRRVDEARVWFQRALELEPDDAFSLEYLGMLSHVQGDLKRAAIFLERAIAADPARAESHRELAFVSADAGRPEQALIRMGEAVALAPRSAEMHCQHGVLLIQLERAEEALEVFGRALGLDPAHADSRLGRAQVYFGEGRVDEAAAEYRRVLELDPTHEGARSSLAFIEGNGGG